MENARVKQVSPLLQFRAQRLLFLKTEYIIWKLFEDRDSTVTTTLIYLIKVMTMWEGHKKLKKKCS